MAAEAIVVILIVEKGAYRERNILFIKKRNASQ
jgi:hypothetical protein